MNNLMHNCDFLSNDPEFLIQPSMTNMEFVSGRYNSHHNISDNQMSGLFQWRRTTCTADGSAILVDPSLTAMGLPSQGAGLPLGAMLP
jgi:hypothetical protein